MKKSFMKMLSAVLCVIMILSSAPLAGVSMALSPFTGASAENKMTDAVNYEESADPLAITVLSNKESYLLADTAVITVKVKNQSDEDFNDVVIAGYSDKHLLTDGTSAVKELASLKKGETAEYSFNVVLNRKTCGVSFFSRIILFFKQLFKSYTAFRKIDDSIETCGTGSLEFKHGSANVSIDVKAWIDLSSEKEIEKMNNVDEQIKNLLDTSEFNSLSDIVQVDEVMDILQKCEDNGLIIKNSVSFVPEEDYVSFTYSSGAVGGVFFKEPSDEFNSFGSPINEINESAVLNTDSFADEFETNGTSVADALVLYSFNLPSDDQSIRRPFYDTLKNNWQSKGINTTIDTSVTVSDLKNISSDYEIVCFSGHGDYTIGDAPIMSLSEIATTEKDKLYYNDLINRRIGKALYAKLSNEYYYYVWPSLFSSSYSSSGFNGKFIYSESCCFLGKYGSYDYSFTNTFLNLGAKAIYGYHNSVYAIYSRESMNYWVELLLQGKTAKAAFDSTVEKYGANDEVWHKRETGTPSDREPNEYAIPVFRGTESAKLPLPVTKYTVTYNANGGSVSPASATVEAGKTVTLPTPTRNGYSCLGWARTSSATSAEFNCGAVCTINGNVTLYAVWKANPITKYTVTYNANGGSVSPASATVEAGKTVTLPTPTRSGYSCLGWATTSSATSAGYSCGASYKPIANTTLYAVWKANTVTKYTVTYNANGGSASTASATVEAGNAVILPTPIRTNYTCLGWAITSSATSAEFNCGASYKPTANITLYAVWKINTYTVTYNANGGSGAPSSQTQNCGESILISTTRPTRSGYQFLGWSTSNTATSPSYRVLDIFSSNYNTTLYAVWGKASVTLSSYSGSATVNGYRLEVGNIGYPYKFTDGKRGFEFKLPTVYTSNCADGTGSTGWQVVSGSIAGFTSDGYMCISQPGTVKVKYVYKGYESSVYTFTFNLYKEMTDINALRSEPSNISKTSKVLASIPKGNIDVLAINYNGEYKDPEDGKTYDACYWYVSYNGQKGYIIGWKYFD